MRTIRTSSNDHDGQPQRVVMRFLAICVSEVRCLRIVWSYRGSRGLRPYFYKRVRQTCVRRRSGVRDRENAFSASPHHARVRAQRAPRARARAISTARARELDCVRTRFGLARASLMAACVRACVAGWLAGCCVRACVRACVAGWLAAGCWLHQNVPRTRQNSQEQPQSDPRTHQNDPRIVCLLVCLFVSLFVSVCLLVC
jgi:hypothetical protein